MRIQTYCGKAKDSGCFGGVALLDENGELGFASIKIGGPMKRLAQ
jgi:hypothetical protein